MQSTLVWQERFTVASFDVDFRGALSLASLFRRFAELAGIHAAHLQVGYDALREEGLAWYLSRIKVEFQTLPHWGDEVLLQTWPKGIERLFAMRDFRLLDKEGRVLLVATSRWLLVELARGKPRKIESLARDLKFDSVEDAIPGTLDKVTPLSPCAQAYERQILPSDLDVNHHVNNAEYAKWVMDCFDVDTQSTRLLRSLQVNYLAETLLGDRVRIGATERPDDAGAFYIEGVSTRSGSTLFQAEARWQ